jgi:hypothetical protein
MKSIRRRPAVRRGWPSAYKLRRDGARPTRTSGPRVEALRRRPWDAEGGRRRTLSYAEGITTPTATVAGYPGYPLRRRPRPRWRGILDTLYADGTDIWPSATLPIPVVSLSSWPCSLIQCFLWDAQVCWLLENSVGYTVSS